MKAIDYDYACQSPKILKQVITIWLSESEIPWATRSKVLTDWRNQRCLLSLPSMEPIDRADHNLAFQQKYLEKVLFKL